MTKKKPKRWRKVSAPQAWTPKMPGESLEGMYIGRTVRNGMYGQYEVVAVSVPFKGTFLVSGTRVIQLVDAAMLARGDYVRITFVEEREPARGHSRGLKVFEMEVGDDDEEDEAPQPPVDQDITTS